MGCDSLLRRWKSEIPSGAYLGSLKVILLQSIGNLTFWSIPTAVVDASAGIAPDYADHRHWLPIDRFKEEYDVIAITLEVGQAL
jgi:hypothetical protein